jgi:hypothetical protein
VPARPDVPAKPAVVVGLAQARRQKRQSGGPPPPPPMPVAAPPKRSTQMQAQPAGKSGGRRAPLPKPFEEPTRAVQDAELLAQVRNAPGPGRVGPAPRAGGAPFDDVETKLGNIDARLLDDHAVDAALAVAGEKFIPTTTEPQAMLFDHDDNEATRLSNVDGSLPGRATAPTRDERTRAVDIRNDPSMSDVDWDID